MNERSQTIPDEELVRRVQDGDAQAFGELVPRYGLLVHGLCTGMAGTAQAAELAHEAFVEAWLKLPTLQDPARFAPWLRTLTLNLCRMWHRQRRRQREWIIDTEIDTLPAAGEDVGSDPQILDALLGGLARLSDDHRLSLALHYWHGLSYEQIAAFLDIPIGTVMSRLHRARTQLRERMDRMAGMDDSPDVKPTDDFRDAVEAEIEVLLPLWEEESADPTPEGKPNHAKFRTNRGRAHSEAGTRLSRLVKQSPDTMRPVLATMNDALTRHAALLLLRAGGSAVTVTVACALDEPASLRRNARRVLCQVLLPDIGQPSLNQNYRRLPLRLTATYVLDAVLRSPVPDTEKADLLAQLLPSCTDQATLVLVCLVLRGLGGDSYEILLSLWRDADSSTLAAVYATALAQHGTDFFAALTDEMRDSCMARQVRALEAAQIGVALIGFCALGPEPADPSLERRVSGSLAADDLSGPVMDGLARRLADLAGHQDTALCNPAIALLGSLGSSQHVLVVRAGLEATEPTTRHAAVVAVRDLDDRGSLPRLQTMASEDQPAVRQIALQSLGQLGAIDARDVIVAALDEEAVRPHAISALGELGDETSLGILKDLAQAPDKKVARWAARALYGGTRTEIPVSATKRERLAKIRGADAQPSMHISVVAAIRHLPEVRPYPEAVITRLIGEVCGDYSTTRRELVMGSPGLMVRNAGIYELSELGLAVWRVEDFLKAHDPTTP